MADKKTTTKRAPKAVATVATKESAPKKRIISEDTVLVVIPYLAAGAQGRELEYAIAGWRTHFKEKYHIVLVGDHHKVADGADDITFIECPRVAEIEGQYMPPIDIVNKLKVVHDAFPEHKGFVLSNDDIYAVNNFDLVDIKFLKCIGDQLGGDPDSANGWKRSLAATREALVADGKPIRNFSLHLPVWYEWDKLAALFEKYDMQHKSLLLVNLYFNTYFGDRIPLKLHIDFDNIKCGIYRSNPRLEYIERAFERQIWINNSVEGWIPELPIMLSDHFGI